MPLICEVWDKKSQEWIEFYQHLSGEGPFSLTLDGDPTALEARVFECDLLDAHTSMYVAPIVKAVNDLLDPQQTAVNFDLLKPAGRLLDGDQPITLAGHHPTGAVAQYRFRHVTLDLGMRTCAACGQSVSAWQLGEHAKTHTTWPGGTIGLIESLIESVEQSISASQGFPRVTGRLQVSRETLVQQLVALHRAQNAQND